ncbi:unnamed protein product [Rotaria magnacalcarata]|uniref:Uncharacterized protein n=2 Tax=Rotaria magnacalcarata TaxID=392030 RepID=A0A815NFZ2_9BILA|nr:unnamed protein product [Rotaria magnacalcarata]CAF1578497.1 unnamed protein product [Rotaria magnacalcarata]CAF2064002.1 unnamed protein product [Rotaria magnacalcarata]CAF2093329.1 unnamed protein product [Rotaria magnacalcarata]CAF2264428.1 unnamed protein product [Rotaria magnacalcarata]
MMNRNRTSVNSFDNNLWTQDPRFGANSPRKLYNTGRLPQTSLIQMADSEQCESPLKLQGWPYVHLYRGVINTADRSVKLLRNGDTNEAKKFWERACLFFDELDRRQNISDKNMTEMKRLKAIYKEHEKQINQIK